MYCSYFAAEGLYVGNNLLMIKPVTLTKRWCVVGVKRFCRTLSAMFLVPLSAAAQVELKGLKSSAELFVTIRSFSHFTHFLCFLIQPITFFAAFTQNNVLNQKQTMDHFWRCVAGKRRNESHSPSPSICSGEIPGVKFYLYIPSV